MPSVPVLPTSGNVSLDTSQGYRRVQADASAFGGREAQALGAVGQGLDAVAHAADEIDQEQARTEALQADNAYAAALRDQLYGPKGYLTQRGENAVNQRAQAEAGIDELAVSTLGNVRNPRARALAEQALRSRAESALGQISEHAANQTRESQLAAIGAAADVASRNVIDGILAGEDPADERSNAHANLASANAAVTRLGELNGWGEVLTTQRRQDLADSITHNVVVELASTDPDRARAYFAAHPVADPTQRRQTLAAMMAEEARAMRTVSGTVYRDFASGANYRNSDAWRRFTTDPLFGDQYMAFQEHVRAQALQSVTMSDAMQDRQSNRVADDLMARATDTHLGGVRMLDLVVQAGQGRLRVIGDGAPYSANTQVMRPEAFQAATGMSYDDAVQRYRALRGDGLRAVLGAIGQVQQAQVDAMGPEALQSTVNLVMNVATARAAALPHPIRTDGQDNAITEARLRDYIYRRVRQSVQTNTPVDPDAIANEALIEVGKPEWHGGTRNVPLFNVAPGTRVTVPPDQVRRIIDAIPQDVGDEMLTVLRRQYPQATSAQLEQMLANQYANSRVGSQ